ncbi:deleted in malignant brain tumors 1 protein-like [Rhinatrema bivittatum]|uniref:deleted in malignant brain tumors 1 protein-like n=1 Tax=Rhinatrema bivittatum TaxID=194408 RepID=UPI00112BA1A3|nr:deleted in malignant brain tumors 1 protein-like [Rhinatrema bivittatum]
MDDAMVVCRQLGCGPALDVPKDVYFGEGEGRILLVDVICGGNESYLWECLHRELISLNCYPNKVASVICSESESSLRLADGGDTCKGRVEVAFDGHWGAVCDDSWDTNDAKVACRELGCVHGGSPQLSYFGPGDGVFLLFDVQCTGNESSLLDCPHNLSASYACDGGRHAGVVCAASMELTVEHGEGSTESFTSLSSKSEEREQRQLVIVSAPKEEGRNWCGVSN